jgi:16S rRNA (guanine527-N7)-methyltransferase
MAPRAAGSQAALPALLADGLAAAGIAVPDGAQARLLAYLGLLEHWNAVHNLTAVRDPAQMVGRHLLDSLAALAYLRGATVLDAGTGAGLPGIPLAVARPDLAFTLVDSARKRTQFVQHALAQLGVRNARVLRADLAALALPAPPATLLARALAPLPELLPRLAHLCGPDTRVLVWRARLDPEARADIALPWRLAGVHPYTVPGVAAARCLVELARAAP